MEFQVQEKQYETPCTKVLNNEWEASGLKNHTVKASNCEAG